MDADQGAGTTCAVLPAVRNIMDMADELLTVLLEHMYVVSDLTHSDRLQCTNRRLRRIGDALGKFRRMRPSSKTIFASLRLLARKTPVDGLKLQGIGIHPQCLGPDHQVDGQQLLCMALGGIAAAPAAPSIRALHIDTTTGRLRGSALGCLWGLRSLQALKIHSLYLPERLDMVLDHLTDLTSLDLVMRLPGTPEWSDGPSGNELFDPDAVCGFPSSIVQCTCLRRLSLRFDYSGPLVYSDDVPDEFGNFTALKTVSLVGCEVASLSATVTRLTRLIRLTIKNLDVDTEDVRRPEGFCSAMPNLQHVEITNGWQGEI